MSPKLPVSSSPREAQGRYSQKAGWRHQLLQSSRAGRCQWAGPPFRLRRTLPRRRPRAFLRPTLPAPGAAPPWARFSSEPDPATSLRTPANPPMPGSLSPPPATNRNNHHHHQPPSPIQKASRRTKRAAHWLPVTLLFYNPPSHWAAGVSHPLLRYPRAGCWLGGACCALIGCWRVSNSSNGRGAGAALRCGCRSSAWVAAVRPLSPCGPKCSLRARSGLQMYHCFIKHLNRMEVKCKPSVDK